MDAEVAPNAHEERKERERLEAHRRLDESIRAYVDKKTSYENSKESKSRPSEPTPEADEPETPDDEPAVDDAQDLDDAVNLPASKSPQIAGATGSFKFDELTPVNVFEEYLSDVQSMTYEELHHRTSKVTSVMLEYQAAWDKVEKECRDHEEAEKLKSLTTAEKEKAIADEKQEEEDLMLVSLEYTYRDELKFSRKPWVEDFSTQFLEDNPDGQLILDRLNKLRDASFFKGFKKRQRALQENRPEQLIDKPLPDPKQTKEERDLEARKRRHLTDAITFDDQLQADAYGFTYLASDLARGNQLLLPKIRVASLPKNLKAGSRPNRNATKGSMVESAENSDVPSGEDELPQKRNRGKPKNFDADNGASSAAESSRGTGSSKTYIGEDGKKRYVGSGKISGRPPVSVGKAGKVPKKSKLDQVFSLPKQGGQSNDNEDEEEQDNDGDSSNGQVLPPGQEDELQNAAALVTHAASPVENRKRGGGRPRGNKQLVQLDELLDTSKSPRKPKSKGPLRKKVDPLVLAEEDELEGAPINSTQGPAKLSRKKRARDDDIAEPADYNTEPNTKGVKNENKTNKLKMKQNVNGTIELGEQINADGEVPVDSIEPHIQSTQSSRPTTSSSKPTTTSKPTSRPVSRGVSVPRGTASGRGSRGGSRPASPAISKPPTSTANINGKRFHDDVEVEAYPRGLYDINVDDGGHASKKSKTATVEPGTFYGTLQQPPSYPPPSYLPTSYPPPSYPPPSYPPPPNGDLQTGGNNGAGLQKVAKKRAPAKRKRAIDGEEGLTTADGTNNNTDAEGGPNKKSKKSREKTAAEKESQSAAMKAKWADPKGKMRQGIDRRKRRDIRKGIEKARTDGGGPVDEHVIYKSDEEGFSYAKWGETTPPPPPPDQPADSTPTQTPDLPTPVADEEFDGPIRDEPEDEFAVESPKNSNKSKTFSTDATPISTAPGYGRQLKPSRGVNRFGGDGAADEDFDLEPPRRPPPLLAQKPRSAYEEFQTITSPGYHLEKRVSKPTFGYGGHNTSEEEEEY